MEASADTAAVGVVEVTVASVDAPVVVFGLRVLNFRHLNHL